MNMKRTVTYARRIALAASRAYFDLGGNTVRAYSLSFSEEKSTGISSTLPRPAGTPVARQACKEGAVHPRRTQDRGGISWGYKSIA